MVVKTFRGMLADGGQDRIRLSTIKGKVGYRIIKFQIIDKDPAAFDVKLIVKVFKTNQTTITSAINFTDSDLLAAAYYISGGITDTFGNVTIFEQEMVNQDIYVTAFDKEGSSDSNYYLELEVIPLDDAGAEYTTLKDMRQS